MPITEMSSIRQCEKHKFNRKAAHLDWRFCFRILDQGAFFSKNFHSLVSGRGVAWFLHH